MLNFKKIISSGIALATLIAASINAIEPFSDLSLYLGWRRDVIKTTANNYGNHEKIGRDTLRIKNIDVWLTGGELYMAVPNFLCDGDHWWLPQFYVRGHAYHGWINQGDYKQVVTLNEDTFLRRTKANRGQVQDYSIGFGVLAGDTWWGIGPVVGWSYDLMKIKTSGATTNGEADPLEDDLTFTSAWYGPWAGVDFMYYLCERDIVVNAGYEYKWGRWRATRSLAKGGSSGDCVDFSDHRNADNAHGQAFFFEGRWLFCPCWDVALGFRYEQWRAHNGVEVPKSGSFEENDCREITCSKVTGVDWHNWGVNVNLGYRF